MQEATKKLVWKSKPSKFYKYNSYIYFGLAVSLIILPVLFFPLSMILEWRWGLAFYVIVYSIIIPPTIFLVLLGLNFLQTHLGIYPNGLKIKRSALNPRKKLIPFNDLENVELKEIKPTNYSSKISKRLLYDLEKNPKLLKTGDYVSLVIKTKNGKPYNIRGSYISEITKTKELIEIEKTRTLTIKPKIIKKPLKEHEKKPRKKEKSVKIIRVKKSKPKVNVPENEIIPAVKTFKKEEGISVKDNPEITSQPLNNKKSVYVEPKKLPTYFCKSCGTKISGSGVFCIKCGKKLK